MLLAERGLPEASAEWFRKAAQGGDPQMRRTIAEALATAIHPALQRVRARVLALAPATTGG
jgi:hypothetical protein